MPDRTYVLPRRDRASNSDGIVPKSAHGSGTTAVLFEYLDWRGAFIVPAVICLVSGVAYLLYVPQDNRHRAKRTSNPDVALPPWIGASLFGLFVMISLSAGLVFHISTVALPKLVDERLGGNVSLALRLHFRAPDRTLTDEEVAEKRGRIAAALARQFGGRVRDSA